MASFGLSKTDLSNAQSIQLQSSGQAVAAKATPIPGIKFRNAEGRTCSVLKQGALSKQSSGLIKKWTKRWFVVSDEKDVLYYWTTKESMTNKEPHRGMYNITGCSIARTDDKTKKNFSFGLFHAKRKALFLHADSNEEMIDWISFLERKSLGLKQNVSLSDFELLALLGKGGFGKVIQVRKRDNNKIYAMKVLRKARVIESHSVESTKTEHSVLKTVNHPFIVRMHFAFQTEERLFFVMEYVHGGEIFTLLQKERRFSIPRSRLYTAELTLALEMLHKMNIIYRDLKPENVLLDQEGHVKLTDFGLAKECGCEQQHFSMVGTPFYMAPEIIQKQGHNRSCDWWSLGSIFFEMLTGLPPFYSNNMKAAFSQIVSQDVEIPPQFPENLRNLLSGLLSRDPATRIGSGESDAQEIKIHPFFSDLNWDKVLAREIRSDYVPQLQNAADTSNFDKRFTADNPELSYAKDRGDPEEVFKGFDFDYVAPVHRRTTIALRPQTGVDQEWDDLVRQSTTLNPAAAAAIAASFAGGGAAASSS